MEVELGSWYIVIFIFAISIAVLFFMINWKNQQYHRDVIGKVKVRIKSATGWPRIKVVEETPDGWVRVGKGDYKLPNDNEQRAAFKKLSEEEKHKLLGDKQIIPPAMEWSWYPEKPWLRITPRVPIRTVDFYENDPRAVTWLREHEPQVTAIIAQAHTRQLDALTAGIRAEQLEKSSKKMMEAIANIAQKNIVYLLSGGSLTVGIVILIMLVRSNGG